MKIALTPRKRGILLLYILCISAIMLIFLALSVTQMQNSTFLTNKLQGETRAYWASRAGLDFAEACIKRNIGWPYTGLASSSTYFGDYQIEITDGPSGARTVHGIGQNGEEFVLNFYRTFSGGDPSYNSLAGGPKLAGLDVAVAGNRTMRMPSSASIYVSCEGRSNAHKVTLEKVFQARQDVNKYGSALYANSADINLTGQMVVTQMGGRTPCIISKGAFNLKGVPAVPTYFTGPLILQGGTIFTGADSAIIGGVSMSANSYSNMGKYNIKVEKMGDVIPPDIKFPATTGASIPGGTYAFMEKPSDFHPFSIALAVMNTSSDPMIGVPEKPSNEVGNKKYELLYTPGHIDMELSTSASGREAIQKSDLKLSDYMAAKLIYETKWLLDSANVPHTQPGRADENMIRALDFNWTPEVGGPKLREDLIVDQAAIDNGVYLVLLDNDDLEVKKAKRIHNLLVFLGQLQKKLEGDACITKTTSGSDFYVIQRGSEQAKTEALKRGSFTVKSDTMALNVPQSLSIDGGDFIFRTLELSGSPAIPDPSLGILDNIKRFMEGYQEFLPEGFTGKFSLKDDNVKFLDNYKSVIYEGANYARAHLNLGEGSGKASIFANANIEIAGLIAGTGELVSNGGNIAIEAGGDISSQSQSRIALYAAQNIYLKYSSAIFGKYNAVSAVQAAYKANPNADVAALLAYSAGKDKPTLAEILGNCGYTLSDFSTNTSAQYFVEQLLSGSEKFTQPVPSYIPASNIKGVIYARRNIDIALNSINSSNPILSIEGVLYCDGNLSVSNTKDFYIRYDPSLSSIEMATSSQNFDISELLFNKL